MREKTNQVKKREFSRYLAVFLVLLVILYLSSALMRPMPAIQPSIIYSAPVIGAKDSTSWPAYGQAAIGTMEAGILATNGKQTSVPTASTAKIITALAVLKVKPLAAGQTETPILTIGPADTTSYDQYVAKDGSVVPVNVGEQLSEYQALQALLLPSANNIAYTLANWAFGSADAYEKYANQLAKDMGLTATHVDDASGFSPLTVSSARDMFMLGQAAMNNPVIANIASQSSVPFPIVGTIHNTNFLLGQNGIIGLKTGNTDQAGGCYIFASKQNIDGQSVTLIGSVMGAPDLYMAMRDSLNLLNSTKEQFSLQKIVHQGQIVAKYHMPWGGTVDAVAAKDVDILVWGDDIPKINTKLANLGGFLPEGIQVGKISLTDTFSNSNISIDIKLNQTVSRPPLLWRLTHPF